MKDPLNEGVYVRGPFVRYAISSRCVMARGLSTGEKNKIDRMRANCNNHIIDTVSKSTCVMTQFELFLSGLFW